MTTAIGWTHIILPDGRSYKGETWNPFSGCTEVSPGCDNCYAATWHNKWHGIYVQNNGVYPNGKAIPAQYAHPFSTVQVFPERLSIPLKWKAPRGIFVNSMSDWLHDDITDEQILAMWRVMLAAKQHIYMLLTKRAPRMRKLQWKLTALTEEVTGSPVWPKHIWLGVTVESEVQRGRAQILRNVPASVRFISYEPALGSLGGMFNVEKSKETLNWIIAGSESGDPAKIRSMQESWVREVQLLCSLHEIAFYYKQKTHPTTGQKITEPELDGVVYKEFPQPQARWIVSEKEAFAMVFSVYGSRNIPQAFRYQYWSQYFGTKNGWLVCATEWHHDKIFSLVEAQEFVRTSPITSKY